MTRFDLVTPITDSFRRHVSIDYGFYAKLDVQMAENQEKASGGAKKQGEGEPFIHLGTSGTGKTQTMTIEIEADGETVYRDETTVPVPDSLGCNANKTKDVKGSEPLVSEN